MLDYGCDTRSTYFGEEKVVITLTRQEAETIYYLIEHAQPIALTSVADTIAGALWGNADWA